MVLETPNKPIKYCYFIESGFASIVAAGGNGKRLEVGLIGREGVTGLSVVLGHDRSPNETFIQAEGEGQRISASDLRNAMEQSRILERTLVRYAHAFVDQASTTAFANGTLSLEQRLARWLLLAADRLDGKSLPLTHEFLSLMLGVRRAGVTTALNLLEQSGLIKLSRKQIELVDRRGLIDATAGAYRPSK